MFAKDPSYEPVPGYQRTRAYRAAHPERVERERRRNAARQRALARLARARAEDFRAIYVEELAAAQIDGPESGGSNPPPLPPREREPLGRPSGDAVAHHPTARRAQFDGP